MIDGDQTTDRSGRGSLVHMLQAGAATAQKEGKEGKGEGGIDSGSRHSIYRGLYREVQPGSAGLGYIVDGPRLRSSAESGRGKSGTGAGRGVVVEHRGAVVVPGHPGGTGTRPVQFTAKNRL